MAHSRELTRSMRSFLPERFMNCTGNLDTDWTRYRHATDQGIAEEALNRYLGRTAVPAEIVPIRERYMALLSAELVHDPQALRVPGAGAAIQRTIVGGYSVAFATGCWEPSARLKLARAGIDIDGLPLATCDDNVHRFEILRLATERQKGFSPSKALPMSVMDPGTSQRRETSTSLSSVSLATSQHALRHSVSNTFSLTSVILIDSYLRYARKSAPEPVEFNVQSSMLKAEPS